MREEGEAQARVWREQMEQYRDSSILLRQRVDGLTRRLNRCVTANRIVVATNQRIRNMNNTLHDLLHEIFEMDPAMRRFYRERYRFPDFDYSDEEEESTDDEGLAEEMINTLDHINALEGEL